MTEPGDSPAADGLSHLAFFYRDQAEYLGQVLPFIEEGLAGAEPVLVAVPGWNARSMRHALNGQRGALAVLDMAELGRNPARITLAVADFLDQHAGQRTRYVTEPAWPGRSSAELAEVIKHEALINLGFAAAPATVLCPYDAARLAPAVIGEAGHTHPTVLARGQRRASPGYRGSADLPPRASRPLPAPPSRAASVSYRTDLRVVRSLVRQHAEGAGLPAERTGDLVLAVSEIAANTLRHTADGGTVHVWSSRDEILCQIHDEGWITEPLAGRRKPPSGAPGQGLWVVNHVCDLAEIRTGPAGTTIRLRMRLPRHGALSQTG